MLDSQINMYSVNTGHFYSDYEKELQDAIFQHLKEQDMEKVKETKETLLAHLASQVNQNILTQGKHHIRRLREQDLQDNNVISTFESSLTRTIGIKQDELTDALIVVQIYYFDVFKDLSFFGFLYKGAKYRYFTSSAGQIRLKKAIFIQEDTWNRVEKTILCGLTIDKINAKGGNNVNKHLAYMALSNSATDEWIDFDIDRCIVIDDFETNVPGTFDFIDEKDYSITRKTDVVPIPHTDGAGMILPSVMTKNTMFRAPWIKGLLGVFDFRKFIEIHNCSPVIQDIYGQEHHIFEEDIQIIFTKSQFKMYKYYDSWEEYKDYFQKYHCQAGLCNTEEDRVKNAKINYQMLQTLTDITDDEIHMLAAKSIQKITNICNSQETMKEALGITPYNTRPTPFQQAVKMYPALLNDTYVKDMLREIKDSLLKKYRSGKLEINGKYTFLLPDFYAACQYWFEHKEVPEGLLADGEVFCRLYKNYETLDCLRSPHLYKEHAIRQNMAAKAHRDKADTIGEKAAAMGEWFSTNGLYTSTHDLISKLLQFDVDGDKSLVVAEPDFIAIAKRNMKDIVPLYYNMKKATPLLLNRENIYSGLITAFTGGNIGTYSNNISKIWNHPVFISGTEEEKQQAIDCVKRLCCQNNFVIDFAKTLYQPEFPEDIKNEIRTFTNQKLPAFFAYAKDKKSAQIEAPNKSFVNTLSELIPDLPINTRGLALDKLEYQNLMHRKNMVCPKEVSELYDRLNRSYRYKINREDKKTDNFHYIYCCIRQEFESLGYSHETIADMLVQHLYGKEKRAKQLLWFCYGQYLVTNLEHNLSIEKTKYIQCIDCGQWAEVALTNRRTCRCEDCQKIQVREKDRLKKKKKRSHT